MFHTSFFKNLTGSWGIPHIPGRRQRYCPPFDLSFSLSSFSSPPKFVLGTEEYHTLSYGPVLGLPFHRSSFPSVPRRRLSLLQKWLAAEAGIFSTPIGRRPLPPASPASIHWLPFPLPPPPPPPPISPSPLPPLPPPPPPSPPFPLTILHVCVWQFANPIGAAADSR